MTDFREDLLNSVSARADVDGDFMLSAFVSELADRLAEAEEIENLVGNHFRGVGGRNKKLAVDGYDLGDSDDSIALAVALFSGAHEAPRLTMTDVNKQFSALEGYLHDAVNGTFEVDREPSESSVQLAVDLRHRFKGATRYRLYLLTDCEMGRATHLSSSELNGVPIDYHVWDITRIEQLAASRQGREELQISMREWFPSGRGLPALRINTNPDLETFLAAVPGRLLADLYGRYGSRLLESNVRSFLSGRRKVNQGIKTTVLSQPEMFLAFNNGVTATAAAVERNELNEITGIRDLQIVNGGQTTASLFYTRRDSSPKTEMLDVHVQMKLVVVDPDLAKDLVPSISRYANSQNPVSEADFFSNSPLHVRLEGFSRRLLAPAQPGLHFQTKWFYERTRGQYQNEKAKLSKAEQKKFEATQPRSQVITKTDAAKYEISWGQQPHMVSRGAQKNFVAFAESVAKRWETSDAEFNEVYFKSLVAKAILFQSIRTRVMKAEWYDKGYLANIVAYTLSKLVYEIGRQGGGDVLDLGAVWNRQGVSPVVLDTAADVARVVFGGLTAPGRLVQNVTEWAKREDCWKVIKAMPIRLNSEFLAELAPASKIIDQKHEARATQKIDNSIQVQTAVFEIPPSEWERIREFGMESRLVSPTDVGILDLVTGRKSGFPSERQSARLISILNKAQEHGFQPTE